MARSFALVLAAALAAGPALGCDQPGNFSALKSDLIAGINAARADAGLRALSESGTLNRAAQAHACDNAARGSTSHTGSDGSTLTDRLRGAGYRFSTAAENTGRGFGSVERALAFWLDSGGHRANILLGPAREIGVGIAVADGTPHWVINFGAPR